MEKWRAFRNSPRYEDAKGGVVKKGKNLMITETTDNDESYR